MQRSILIVLLAAGCAGPSSYRVSAGIASPELVYAGPGVYAVANANAPVFYADDYYWLYDDGLWFRSNYVSGGWHRAYPPHVIRRIERPRAYVRYNAYRPERRIHVDHRDRARRSVIRDRSRPHVIDRRDTRTYRDRRVDPRDSERRFRVRETPRARAAPARNQPVTTPRGRSVDRDVRARDRRGERARPAPRGTRDRPRGRARDR